jgi:hypothetical protein
MTQAYESRLNIILSQLLEKQGIVSRSEFIGKGRKDVIVYHQGIAIVLEGSYSKQDAEKDTNKRIEQLSADVGIAVFYPQEYPQTMSDAQILNKLQNGTLSVRVIAPEDISNSLYKILYQKNVIAKPVDDWHEVNLTLLTTLIQEITQYIISEESINKVEEEVSSLIQEFVTALSFHHESDTIAKNMHDVLYELYGFSIGDPVKLKEAIFAQSVLAMLLSSIYYDSIRYAHKLDSLESLTLASDAQKAIVKATHDILEIDYEPIFEAIEEMLKSYPSLPMLFAKLVKLASEIASKKSLLRRDLAGKVYHKVVGSWSLKKGLATFYTQIPAAYLLLYLAKPRLSRIADFSCGSGTLLVAAYSAANSFYRMSLLQTGSDLNPKEIETDFHTQFINSCYAFDVLEYASQITALNLALHSPETPIPEYSSIYTMPLGYREKDDIVSLGSLELARTRTKFGKMLGHVTQVGIKKKRKSKELMTKLMNLEPFDLIVMNPPFARTTGRGGKEGGGMFGFMSDEHIRNEVLKDYTAVREDIRGKLLGTARTLLKGTDLELLIKDDEFSPYTHIWQAGEGFLFLYLADLRLKNNGKICFVLPKSLLSGISWFLGRVLIAAKYHLKYVIVSYESDNYNFSESTSLSECMFVAERTDKHLDREETTFVTILKKPHTSIEAIALANRIDNREGNYIEAGNSSAFLSKVTRKELLENVDNWGRFVFLPSIELQDEVINLLDGAIKIGNKKRELPLTRLNNLVTTIGVDRHRFVDTFKVINDFAPGSMRMLQGGEEEQRKTMSTIPNAYILPSIERGKAIYEEKAGRFLIPDRIWIETAHVTSMISTEPVLSNIFYSVRLKDENLDRMKALCLWLNTTWGILTTLASREETRGGFLSLKMSQWRLLPVLNIDSLGQDKLEALASIYDNFKDKDLGRIPEQYREKGRQLRTQLDQTFLKVIGIDVKESDLHSLYDEITSSLKQWLGERTGSSPAKTSKSKAPKASKRLIE